VLSVGDVATSRDRLQASFLKKIPVLWVG